MDRSPKGSVWQLSDGRVCKAVNNDHVLEAHYRHPAVKGITINFEDGPLFIDFDTMQTSNVSLRVQRLSLNQSEPMGWYFRDTDLWREYGSLSSGNQCSTLTSEVLEQHFNANPEGSVQFSVGPMQYSLQFSTMTQTNLLTNINRKVRRRPKWTPSGVHLHGPIQPPPLTHGGYTWEFMGDEGVWTEYQAHLCSFDSAAIETRFQWNPQGTLSFSVGAFSYSLSFPGMVQVNNSIGTRRAVRRLPRTNSSLPRWQFKDITGQWKDYSKGCCSISSQDIEAQYQQNQAGSLNFSTRNFQYELNFATMTQRNLQTNTIREVRRSL